MQIFLCFNKRVYTKGSKKKNEERVLTDIQYLNQRNALGYKEFPKQESLLKKKKQTDTIKRSGQRFKTKKKKTNKTR